MSDQAALTPLGVSGSSIWGDDLETAVFAQAYQKNHNLIFRFTLTDSESAPTLPSRIVDTFHDLSIENSTYAFPNRAAMRTAVWSAVAQVWHQCTAEPDIVDSDVVIDIRECMSGTSRGLTWSICHERALFNKYLNLLSPLSQLAVQQPIELVSYQSLARGENLGGQGSSACVQLIPLDSSRAASQSYVYKGIDFGFFLECYENGHVKEEVKMFHRSLEFLHTMPPHPNIQSPAQTLVTIHKPGENDKPLVCGSLYPALPHGDLSRHITLENEANRRIPASQKAKWCCEMVSAIAHTHFVAHTYHMDIKLENMVLNDDWQLILIDWEQSGTSTAVAAPEIDGTWDVERDTSVEAGTHQLRYMKYSSPKRTNTPEGTAIDQAWNVYPVWSKECPKALELAEVFSLGRCMWMLLRQPDMRAF